MNQLEVMKLNRVSKVVTLIVKPTNDCNLDCKYCYDKPIRHLMPKTRMTLDTFEHSVSLINKYAEKVNILWHGGEATLMGKEFYYKASEIINKYYTTEFTQQMQTNGTLIHKDNDWINVFKDCGISPGTSYDGTYQYMRDNSTTDYMRDVMLLLNENKLSSVGGITIVHNDNLNNLIDYYDFLKAEFNGDYGLTLNLGFMTEETESEVFNLDPANVYARYRELYNHMIMDTSNQSLFELNFKRNINGLLKPNTRKGCELVDCKNNWLTVLADGTLIPCSRFSVYHNFGNILDYTSIEEVFMSDGFQKYCELNDARHTRLCSECKAFKLCNGGCPAKFMRNNLKYEKSQCDYIKALFLSAYDSLLTTPTTCKLNRHLYEYLTGVGIVHPHIVTKSILDNTGVVVPVTTNEDLNINNPLESHLYNLILFYSDNLTINYQIDLTLQEIYESTRHRLDKFYIENKYTIDTILEETNA